jgi:hypothetical protein
MRSRLTKAVAALTLVASLAVGGAAFASASSKSPSKAPAVSSKAPSQAPAKEPAGGVDTDTLQEGDQSTPDVPGASESPSSESASEPAGESSSEVPGNDGPGGHADEPGNPNADNQFEGVQ